MATTIRFSANEGNNITVSEDVEAVFEAFTAAAGLPFAVTSARGERKVYVNPQLVAYWHEAQRGTAHFG